VTLAVLYVHYFE